MADRQLTSLTLLQRLRANEPDAWARMVALYRARFEHYGHGKAEDAIVGLGGQVYLARNSQDAVREFRPYFDVAPVYGHGPSLEDFMEQTPLTVGSVQQAVERTLGFKEYAGNYQRQLFLVDHAGLPLDTVLRQLDLLGEVVAELRKHETPDAEPVEALPRSRTVGAASPRGSAPFVRRARHAFELGVPRGALRRGSDTTKRVFPGSGSSTRICPPCADTIWSTM